MSKETVTEWAIQDEATGEWWGRASTVGWGGAGNVYRYSYARAVSATSEIIRGTPTARIVPAPPREMTDAECWEWAEHDCVTVNVCGKAKYSVEYSECGMTQETDYFPTACDAIRDARKKLEGK